MTEQNKTCRKVIEDVICGSKSAFYEDGIDESILLLLKESWQQKLVKCEVNYDKEYTDCVNSAGLAPEKCITSGSNEFPSKRIETKALKHKKDVAKKVQYKVHKQSKYSLPKSAIASFDLLNIQTDGPTEDTSDDDDFPSESDEPSEDNDDEQENIENDSKEEPLNSDDDVTDEDPAELFETDNIVVCQYEKITRNRNMWKFHLKDGIMNLNGKDYLFQKASGYAEW